jgi:Fe-S-cluster containining protein
MNRTTCACADCVACCKQQPGALVAGELERIAAHLGETVDEAKAHFWASPGALVGDRTTGRVFRVGTITPRFDRKRGRCVFLTDEDRCAIHAVAPFGCAFFDTHMSGAEGQTLAAVAIKGQQSEAYQQLRKQLPLADHYKPFAH